LFFGFGRPRHHILQAVDRRREAEDFQQRCPRLLVRFFHALRAAPLLQQIRRVSLRHAEIRIERDDLLTLGFPRGVDVTSKGRRAESRNILSRASLGQPPKLLPFLLDHLRPWQFFVLLLDVRDDHFAAQLDQAEPSRFLHFMHRIAGSGRMFKSSQHFQELLRHLAKPILNLDNHHLGSLVEHWNVGNKNQCSYPGAHSYVQYSERLV